MDIISMSIWAELKLKILETAIMINDGYSEEDIIEHLLDIAEYIDTTQPRR